MGNSSLDLPSFVTSGNENIDHLLNNYYGPGSHGSDGIV